MRAVTIRAFGDASGLELGELPEPKPAIGQVLIATAAIGVGGVDAVIRRGTLGGSGFTVGLVPGSEVAGTVTAVGAGVDPVWIGRRVWAFTGISGGYAEFAIAGLDDVTALPDGLSLTDAVALGSAGPVAHFALRHAHFTAGESVLVRGASGSIGVTAVQLASAAGARAVGVTTSSPERGKRLRELGATHILDRSGAGEGKGDAEALDWDVIIDIVGGDALPGFVDRLALNGRLVSVGVVAGYPPADFGMALMRAFQRSLTFSTFSLNTVSITERNLLRAQLFESAARGEVHAVVHEVLRLERAAEAHQRMDAGEVLGRFVLVP